MEAFQSEIISLVVTVLGACAGLITKQVLSYLKKKGLVQQLESHKEIVKIVVTAVEQTYKHLHGNEKLELAKIEVAKLAKQKNLKISEKELDLMIEAMVKEMNKAVKEELKK
jgi:LL-H family phage holin